MPVVDYPLHVKRTGDGRILLLELTSQEIRNAVWSIVERAESKHGGFIRCMFDMPAKPIKTGPRSQLNRHWGHCEDLAAQLTSEEHPITKEMVDVYLRKLAVKEGFPTAYNALEDIVEPAHFNSSLTVENANIVELVKRRFADKFPLWLHEYHEVPGKPPVPYKSVQGRTYEEMQIFWKEVANK